ncbi:HD-GYP domain-containing protein [Paenibacillus silviterrae]|uniref:HD-GYP domain-containing protein n=1 Tax=Paenibacillus silviterrae TaxID=3242194 RepID=UPI0025427B34|nr:HD-GYP domain-containing protein [Paenibacillus chinjuensis]
MAHEEMILNNPIGKAVNRDIYSASGVLLVAASTIITRDHSKLLERHGIVLTSQDLYSVDTFTAAGTAENQKMVDEAVIQVSQLFEEIRETRKVPLQELRSKIIPVIQEAANTTSLYGLITSFQSKDDYTYRHNLAVGVFGSLLGNWIGLERQELLQLTTAAFLHDIGKMLIPGEILNKPDRLTVEEYSMMKSHTVIGYEILKETVGVNHRQALVALQHHERMDGSGYPFGLKQKRIDLFSRIVAVADVFHAMTSKRVYRNPSPFFEVLFQMERDAFGVLDPAVIKVFIGKIMNTLVGRPVLLTDGSEGTILLIHPNEPTRPLIQIGGSHKDLRKDLTVHIKQIH